MKRILPFAKKDVKKILLKNFEVNNISQNYLRKNEALPLYVRQKSILILNRLFKKINVSKLNYVCIFTGKSRAVSINYKVSNLMFKILLKRGLLTGFKI